MKTYLQKFALLILIQLSVFFNLSAQVANTENANTQDNSSQNNTRSQDDDDGGLNTRISFMLGAGFSGVLTNLYEEPVIDKVTNFVKIQEATALRTNLSLGIIYSPYVYEVSRQVRQPNGAYETIRTNIAYGWSMRYLLAR
jgi:hypothetical protein